MKLNLRIAIIGTISICMAIAGCATQSPTGQPYGAQTPLPYRPTDLEYGRKLQAKIEATRLASADSKIAKTEIEPFKIVGDLYFVGIHNFGVYVIKTPEGVIMLDAGWADTADKTEASLKKIGINVTDIKIMLTTENHSDHNGAAAYFKEKSGAKLYVMEGDVEAMERGSNALDPNMSIRPVKVDRILHDRDQVRLGGKVLTAYHIPGHTKGSTTWFWQEKENGTTYNVADVCCWEMPNNVVSDPNFPTARLQHNWEVLKSLPVDIPTPGTHTYNFDLIGKLERAKAGEKNVWIDQLGYRGVIAAYEQDFEDKLQKQLKDGPPPPRVRIR